MLKRLSILLTVSFVLLSLFSSCKRSDMYKKQILVLTDLNMNYSSIETIKSSMIKELGKDNYDYTFIGLSNDDVLSENSFIHPETLSRKVQESSIQPDLIVLYGDKIAHCAASCDDPVFSATPVIYMNVRFPEYKGLIASKSNFCGFKEPMDIRKNIDLIHKIRPYNWVTTNLDTCYIDDLIRDLATTQLSDESSYNANLGLEAPYTYLEPEDRGSSRMTLIPLSLEDESLNWKDKGSNVGFDYRSLYYSERSQSTFLRLKTDYWSELATYQTLGYYYSATPEKFNAAIEGIISICVGGYFTPIPVMMDDLHEMVTELFKKGKTPAEIGQRNHSIGYWLDWNYMKNVMRYASDFPKEVNFVNLPWKDRSPYHEIFATYYIYLILMILILSIITLVISIGAYHTRKQEEIIHQGNAASATILRESMLLSSFNAYFFDIDKDDNVAFTFDSKNMIASQVRTRLDKLTKSIVSDNVQEFIDLVNESKPGQNEIILAIKDSGLDDPYYLKVIFENVASKSEKTKVIGLMIRIDDLIKGHNELKEAYRRDEESIMKSSFLASMGHEIRTPLNAIVGFSKIMVEMYDMLTEDEKTEYSGIITSNTEQLLSLIDNVITYSESKGKDLSIELSKKNVSTLMEELYLTHSVIVPSNLQFKFIKGNLDDAIMVNRSSMLQVVSNLMNNAIKFTQSGYIAMGWTEDDDNVSIFVEDTGCGVSDAFIGKIFDKYAKETSGSKGAGIGLALCKRLVEKMNGKIEVKSTFGKGTRFDVVFPKVK